MVCSHTVARGICSPACVSRIVARGFVLPALFFRARPSGPLSVGGARLILTRSGSGDPELQTRGLPHCRSRSPDLDPFIGPVVRVAVPCTTRSGSGDPELQTRGLPPVGQDRPILTLFLRELRLVIRPNVGSESDALLPTGVFLDSAPYRGAMPNKFAGALQFAARSRGGFLPAGRRFPGNSPVDKP